MDEKQLNKMAEKEIQAVLKKHKLKFGYSISFPIYNIIPDEVNLAMSVLQKHGMKITVLLKTDK